jgi:hypothetical protein
MLEREANVSMCQAGTTEGVARRARRRIALEIDRPLTARAGFTNLYAENRGTVTHLKIAMRHVESRVLPESGALSRVRASLPVVMCANDWSDPERAIKPVLYFCEVDLVDAPQL